MTSLAGAERWGAFGRRPLVVLSLVAFVDAVDRGILPGVLSDVQDDLGFSDLQAGVLGTAFVVASFLVTVPAGYLADRVSRTRTIAIVLAAWGLLSVANAAVTGFAQFVAVRALLGVGETVDNPASQSLIADYYPAAVRGRAYAWQRAAPLFGTAFGTAVGGLVAALSSWRWAFVLVGVPGSALAIACWRLPHPPRGASDAEAPPRADAPPRAGRSRTARADLRAVLAVPALRAIMFGTAIAAGALSGIGFWAPSFFERHTSLREDQASGVVGALILVGAIGGTLLGGRLVDRLTARGGAGSPALRIAACTQAAGGAALLVVFLPVPLPLRIVASLVGVAGVVAGFPALNATTASLVPGALRGMAFSAVGFLTALASAVSPLLIGAIADRFEFVVDGEAKGHLAYAFLIVLPLLFVGAGILWRGRHLVVPDSAPGLAGVEPAPDQEG